MSEREHAVDPFNAAFDPGGRRRRPGTSAASVAPIARAPSSPRTAISLKRNPPPPATSPSCGQQPLHRPGGPSRRPEQVEMRRAGIAATTGQGIKNTSSPAGNVGERARRRPLQRGVRSGRSAPSTRYLRSVGRSDRPSSIVAPNRNIAEKESTAAGDLTIVRPAAAAPTRRPEQVEMRRAGIAATTGQGIKNTSSPAGNVGERARRRPLQRGVRSGRSAPSTRYLRSVGRSDRPSSIVAPNRNIAEKESTAAGDLTIVRPAAAAPTRRPEQVEMRRAGIAATTGQGIKNTSSPAGNVGERARRRPLQRGVRSGRSAPSTRYLRSVGRSDRPSSIVAPNRNIAEKESTAAGDLTIVRPAAAAPTRRPEQVEMRRAGIAATTGQGTKNTSSPAGNVGERARRRPLQRGVRSGRSAPSTRYLRSVGRSDRPSSIVAPNRNIAEKESTAAGDLTIVRPAAAAPTRRPEQVEMRRAGIAATTGQGIKNTSSPAGNVGERARRRPLQRGVRSGRSAPSTRYLRSVGRSDRPSSIVAPNRNIAEKESTAAGDLTIVRPAAAAPTRRPEQVEMRRAGIAATTGQGIKNTSSPAGNVGERARRRPLQRGVRSGRSAPSTRYLRSVGRSDRPSSIVAPNRNIAEKESTAAGDLTIVRPAAAAPTRRPEQVEMRRAGIAATTGQGTKNTSSPAGNVGERARRRPLQRGVRSGRSAPSTRYLRSVGRSDRPSSIVAPNRNIAEKESTAAGDLTIVRPAAAAPTRRPEQVEMRRAGIAATTGQGIKNTSSPAGNVGERARRRPLQRGVRSGRSAPSTRYLRSVGRSDRPSSIVAPNRNIAEKESTAAGDLTIVRPAAAAPTRRPEQVEMRRAGIAATTGQGTKNTSSPAGNVGERARRRPLQRGVRSGRSAPSTRYLRSVGRSDRPSSIVAPNRNIAEKESTAAGDLTIVRPAAAAPTRRPEQVEMRRAGIAATTGQGIKNTSSPAGNVGERARRRPLQRGVRSGRSAPSTRYLRSVGRSDRPSSIVAPNRNIAEKESTAAGDLTIVRPAAAAPTRRPEQVEMRRAGIAATTGQGTKNTSSPAGNVGERARRRPLQRGVRSGRSAPSTRYLRSVGRSDRPSSIVAPNRNIAEKESTAAGDLTIVRPAAAAPTRRPEQVEMRRAGIAATTGQGIKNTSSPAGNVGERARRRPLQRGVRSGRSAPSTRYLRSVGRSDRPSSIVAPNRNIAEKESTAAGDLTIVRPAAAAPTRRPEQVEMRRAGIAATTGQGIKNTSSPAGHVGERARRRPLQRGVRSGRPSSIVAPNRNIAEKESTAAGDLTIVRPAAAAPTRRPEQVEMRRAGI